MFERTCATPGQAEDEIVEKRIVRIDVFSNDTQVKVGFAAGGEAFEDLGVPLHFLHKALDVLLLVPGERHVNDGGEIESCLARVHDDGIAVDDAGLLETLDASPAGRTRHAGAPAEFLHGEAAVALQFGEDFAVFLRLASKLFV